MDISVVLPCLNEEETVGVCVTKARAVFDALGLEGEVIVVDNGSDDRSVEMAEMVGATVIREERRGYGRALATGFEAASGEILVMADADETYDLAELPLFFAELERGADFVIGNRNAGMARGAMPFLHRFLGNPFLSWLVRRASGARVRDAYCGYRVFQSEVYSKLHSGIPTPVSTPFVGRRVGDIYSSPHDVSLSTITHGGSPRASRGVAIPSFTSSPPGMEFALWLLVNAARSGAKIAEVPISYAVRKGESKLQTFRDGWRSLRFLLLVTPKALFIWPGVILTLVSLALFIPLTFGPVQIGSVALVLHPIFLAALGIIVGTELVHLGIQMKLFAVSEGFDVAGPWTKKVTHWFSLERMLIAAGLILLAGIAIGINVWRSWAAAGYGELEAVRPMVAATTLMALGVLTKFHAFSYTLLLGRRD